MPGFPTFLGLIGIAEKAAITATYRSNNEVYSEWLVAFAP
jgi:hypothetical protein